MASRERRRGPGVREWQFLHNVNVFHINEACTLKAVKTEKNLLLYILNTDT